MRRAWIRSLLLPAAALAGSGCDDGALAPFGFGGGDGVVPWLTASPPAGQVPHAVVLDATASEGEDLEFRWDFDGDGTYDTPFAADGRLDFVYFDPGTYRPAVEARSKKTGRSARGVADAAVVAVGPRADAPRTADLDVDVDRDGALTGLDEVDEDAFTGARGAAVLANVDDDDGDGMRDGRDDQIGADDLDDLARARLGRLRALESGDRVVLRVDPEGARFRTRVFAKIGGDWRQVADPEVEENELSAVEATRADLELRIEAISTRSVEFDGTIRVAVQVVGDDGRVVSEDAVVLVVPPVIFQDNLQRAETMYVMRIEDGWDSNHALMQALEQGLDADVELYDVDAWDYGVDRWMQDNMELGYQQVPDGAGVRTMRTTLQLQRATGFGGLEAFVPYEKMRADDGFVYPGGPESSHNYGGNLEVAPPHVVDGVERPYGRMLYGGGDRTLLGAPYDDTMNDEQLSFLDAQVQGPALELSSEWLAVGHIDEIFQFVPTHDPAAPKPFVVVVASPSLARAALLDAQARGLGGAAVFPDQETETTVDAILGDADMMAFNEAADARIASIREEMKSELGLDDADFREVPVLYENVGDRGYDLAVALNPGIQNLVTTSTRLFLPDPMGPVVDGEDVWRAQTIASLQDTGLDLVFVDVFNSYHLLMGEAHCGTNVDRAPYERAWWSL